MYFKKITLKCIHIFHFFPLHSYWKIKNSFHVFPLCVCATTKQDTNANLFTYTHTHLSLALSYNCSCTNPFSITVISERERERRAREESWINAHVSREHSDLELKGWWLGNLSLTYDSKGRSQRTWINWHTVKILTH